MSLRTGIPGEVTLATSSATVAPKSLKGPAIEDDAGRETSHSGRLVRSDSTEAFVKV